MIIHIVLFRWKKGVTQREVRKMMSDLRQLKNIIPQVVTLYCGENFSKFSQGFTHALVVSFKNRSDLDSYRTNPAHKPIAKRVSELEADSLGVDFEV